MSISRLVMYQSTKLVKIVILCSLALGSTLYTSTQTQAQSLAANVKKEEASSTSSSTRLTGGPILNREDAIARAKLLLPLIPEGAEVDNVTKGIANYKSWNIGFVTPETDDNGRRLHSVNIELRESDGKLMEFQASKWSGITDTKEWDFSTPSKIDIETAATIAKNFAENQPWKLDAQWVINPARESEYSTRTNDKSQYKFRFNRLVNGIRTGPYGFNEFSIFVDRTSGEVTSYQVNWHALDFADPKGIISKETAQSIILDNSLPFLFRLDEEKEFPLLYSINDRVLDAKTGKFPKNYNNEPVSTIPTGFKPKLKQEQAKRLLLSMYDVELQYFPTGNNKAELFYHLIVKPSVPLFYTGSAPFLDSNTGKWLNLAGDTVADPVPANNGWVYDLVASPKRIKYAAAVVLDGQLIPLKAEPIIEKNEVLIPFRELLKAMQANVTWNSGKKLVTATTVTKKVQLTIGSKTAYINGKSAKLTVPARMINKSTVVPARFLAEALGATVTWNAESKLLLINTKKQEPPTKDELKQLRLKAQLNWEALLK
ncbi:stalk domain-containing protein [Cohnella abietis]|uniref:Uncharacterized protein n=1 Tax=Cohnella abietis TaxID=2507935 RepID=A0A3T1DBD2_9BACL|nr:stalk domain-containing protein [Cohnella abietis]BBI35436.1 hypothetical protein KCTCHS21_48350 [Cohnella abietis]